VQVNSASEFAGLYLMENDVHKKLSNYLDNVFYDKTNDCWITWLHMGISKDTKFSRKIVQYIYNIPKVKFWARNRVIKFIQANMMISWLESNYACPIVYVIREPYAVIRSQINMGWNHDVSIYLRQKKIRKDLLNNDLFKYVKSLSTIVERLAARWCIENILATRVINRSTISFNAIIPVTYEFLSREKNMDKLLKKTGYSTKERNVINKVCAIRERVRSSKRKSTKKIDLTKEQYELIRKVLSSFQLSSYKEMTSSFNNIRSYH